MTSFGREAAIDLSDERRSAKHQLGPDTGLSAQSNNAAIINKLTHSPLAGAPVSLTIGCNSCNAVITILVKIR